MSMDGVPPVSYQDPDTDLPPAQFGAPSARTRTASTSGGTIEVDQPVPHDNGFTGGQIVSVLGPERSYSLTSIQANQLATIIAALMDRNTGSDFPFGPGLYPVDPDLIDFLRPGDFEFVTDLPPGFRPSLSFGNTVAQFGRTTLDRRFDFLTPGLDFEDQFVVPIGPGRDVYHAYAEGAGDELIDFLVRWLGQDTFGGRPDATWFVGVQGSLEDGYTITVGNTDDGITNSFNVGLDQLVPPTPVPVSPDATSFVGQVTLPNGTVIDVSPTADTREDAIQQVVTQITPQLIAAAGRPEWQRTSITVTDNGDNTYTVTLRMRSGHPMDRGVSVSATVSLEDADPTAYTTTVTNDAGSAVLITDGEFNTAYGAAQDAANQILASEFRPAGEVGDDGAFIYFVEDPQIASLTDNGDGTYTLVIEQVHGSSSIFEYDEQRSTRTTTFTIQVEETETPVVEEPPVEEPGHSRALQVVDGEVDGDTPEARAEDASIERAGEAWAQVVNALGEVPDWTEAEWFNVLLGFYSGESGAEITRADWNEFFQLNVDETTGELITGPLSGKVVETFGVEAVRNAWRDAPYLIFSRNAHKTPEVMNAQPPIPSDAFLVPPSGTETAAARTAFATNVRTELLRTGMTQFATDDSNREFFLTGLSGDDILNGLMTEDSHANHALIGAIMWVAREVIDGPLSGPESSWEGPTVAQLDSADLAAEDTTANPNAFAVYEVTLTVDGTSQTVLASKADLERLENDPAVTITAREQVRDVGSARLFWAKEALQTYEADGFQPPVDAMLAQAFYTLHVHYAPAAEIQKYTNKDYSDPTFVHQNTTHGTSRDMLFDTSTIDTTPQRTDAYVLDYMDRVLNIEGDPTVDSIVSQVTGATTIVDVASGWATGNTYHDEYNSFITRGPQLHAHADAFATALSTRGRTGTFLETAFDDRGDEAQNKEAWTLGTIAVAALLDLVAPFVPVGGLLTATGRVERVAVAGRSFYVTERAAAEALRVAQEADSTITALTSAAFKGLNAADQAKVLAILNRASVASPFVGALLGQNASLTGAAASTSYAIYEIASDGSAPVEIRAGASASEAEQEDTSLTGRERIDSINTAWRVVDAYRAAEAAGTDPVLAALTLMQDLSPSMYHAVLGYVHEDIKTALESWQAGEVQVALDEAPFDLTAATPPAAEDAAIFFDGMIQLSGNAPATVGLVLAMLEQVEATYGRDAAVAILAEMDPAMAALVVAYSQAQRTEAAAKSGDETARVAPATRWLVTLANTDRGATADIMTALAASDPLVAAQAVYDVGRLMGVDDAAKLMIGMDPDLAGRVLVMVDELNARGDAAGHAVGVTLVPLIVRQILAQTPATDIDTARLAAVSYLAHSTNMSAEDRTGFIAALDADDQTGINAFFDDPGLVYATASTPGTDDSTASALAAAVLLSNMRTGQPDTLVSVNDPTILARMLTQMSDEDAAFVFAAFAEARPDFALQAVDFAIYDLDDGFGEAARWFQLVDPETSGKVLQEMLGDDRHQDIATLMDAIDDADLVAALFNTMSHDASEGIMALMLDDGLVSEVLLGGVYVPRTPNLDNVDALPPEVQAKMDSLAARVASGEITEAEARSELMDFMLSVEGFDPEDGEVRVRSEDGTQSWSLDQLHQIYTDTKNQFLSIVQDPTQLFDSFLEELDAFVQANFPALIDMRDELMELADVLFNGVGDMSEDDARRRLSEIFEIEEEDVDDFIGDVRELMNATNTTDVPSESPSETPSGSPSDQPSDTPTNSNPPSSSPTNGPYVPPERVFEAFASIGLNYQFRAKFSGQTTFAGFDKFTVQPIFLLGLGSAGTSSVGTVGHDLADNKLNYQVRLRLTLNGSTSDALQAYLPFALPTGAVPSIDSEFAFDLRFKLTSVFGEGTRVDAIQIAAYNEPSVSSLIFPSLNPPAAGATPPPEKPSLLNILLAQIRFTTERPLRGAGNAVTHPRQSFNDFTTWVASMGPALSTAWAGFVQNLKDNGTAAKDAVTALIDGMGHGIQGIINFIANGGNITQQNVQDFLQSLIAYSDDAIAELRKYGSDFNDPVVQFFDNIRTELVDVYNTPVAGANWREQTLSGLKKAVQTAGLGLLTVGLELPVLVAYNALKYVGIGVLWSGYSIGKLGLSAGLTMLKGLGTALHEIGR
ncbi:MAG: hypothetical protein AAFN94_12470, partial [Pseudomonadota bacterium]